MVDMLILSNAEIHSEIESDSEEDLDQSMNDDSSLFEVTNILDTSYVYSNDYFYKFKRLNKDESTYYTCISAKCKCSITLKNEKTSTDKMINYFDNTWMMGRYPRALWNHSNTIGPRTNNNVEGFHSKFNRSIGSSHPHIFKLIKLFQDYESLFSIKFERIQSGLELVIRKKKFVERDKKIFDLVNQLQSNLMSLEIFILKAAFLIGTEPK
ncbi:unnamed protein product [Brachionus calyciflorus]|uniref:Uncharacterized protein n=1 Tax=Brachionus calyciflorus TaxID=104777 RepID=A0A814NRN6_9BILA|nr:unnamed protein product [Brachionus calyciflorus]